MINKRVLLSCLLMVAMMDVRQVAGQTEVQCVQDSECDSRCCDYVKEYFEGGPCVSIEDLPRCEQRKRNHRIALYVILGMMFVLIAICVHLKSKEKRLHREKMMRLKIAQSHAENQNQTRAKTEALKSRETRLTAGVSGTMPSRSPRPQTQV